MHRKRQPDQDASQIAAPKEQPQHGQAKVAPQEDPPERVVISDVIFDQNGALWVVGDWAYVEGSIAKYEDQSWTRFIDIPDLSDDVDLQNLEVDSQGKVWAIYDDGLFSYDGQNWIHYPLPETKTLEDSFIDSDDRIWITTINGFASFYDGGWNFYTVDNNSSIYDYGRSDPQNRVFFDHKMHSGSHLSSNFIPSPKDGHQDEAKLEEDKFNTVEHKNYEISTLE